MDKESQMDQAYYIWGVSTVPQYICVIKKEGAIALVCTAPTPHRQNHDKLTPSTVSRTRTKLGQLPLMKKKWKNAITHEALNSELLSSFYEPSALSIAGEYAT